MIVVFRFDAVNLKPREREFGSRALMMAKYVPALGTVVLVGVVVQVILGFQVAADVPGLREPHMGIGILGLILVFVLAGFAFKSKTSTLYSKIAMTLMTLVVIFQVVLGFQVLSGAEVLVTTHEMIGFVAVLLALLTGGITFWNSKKTVRHL